jgi:hypothetical protein
MKHDCSHSEELATVHCFEPGPFLYETVLPCRDLRWCYEFQTSRAFPILLENKLVCKVVNPQHHTPNIQAKGLYSIQDTHKRMVRCLKLVKYLFTTLHRHNSHCQQVSRALPSVRFSCLLWGRGTSFLDGVTAEEGLLCAPF